MSDTEVTFRPDAARYARSLTEMIRCATISFAGFRDEQAFVDYMNYLKFRYPLVFSKCEDTGVDGCIFLKWKGKTEEDALVLMSHSDVVPAEGDWRYPPFEGILAEGKIWGRGAVDTKSSFCAILEAVESLLAENYIPEKDVYILSSFSEEIAGDGAPNAVKWLKEHGVTVGLVVDEGGAVLESPLPMLKKDLLAIGICERSSVRFLIEANAGKGKNALTNLSEFVTKKAPSLGKQQLTPELRELLRRLAPELPAAAGKMIANIDRFEKPLIALLSKLLPGFKAMFGPCVSFVPASSAVTADVKAGYAPAVAVVSCNQCDDLENAVRLFKEYAAKNDIAVKEISRRVADGIEPLDGEGFRQTEKIANKVYGELIAVPYPIVGNTDARHFVGYAKNCIRMSPVKMTFAQIGTFHNKDENVNFDSMTNAVLFYRELVMDL
ncbi:MAG: M20/M25/M40 family metallo-hydrolase [Clostridia bacterium]|nr:M20/M25/M40 family metallo-hydrolase [Clostridia bacterium]